MKRQLRRGLVVSFSALTVACTTSSPAPSAPTSASPTIQPLVLSFTTWALDANVTNGPEPGYRPAFSGLSSHDIQTAAPMIDSTGTTWEVNVTFTPRGRDLFARLTRDNVAACPAVGLPVCAQRHLGIWLELTQADIDRWEEPAYVTTVGSPADLACLAHATRAIVCPKLLSDPVTLEEITGGQAVIGAIFTQQSANYVSSAITQTR